MAASAKAPTNYLQYHTKYGTDKIPIRYVVSSIPQDGNQGPNEQGEKVHWSESVREGCPYTQNFMSRLCGRHVYFLDAILPMLTRSTRVTKRSDAHLPRMCLSASIARISAYDVI